MPTVRPSLPTQLHREGHGGMRTAHTEGGEAVAIGREDLAYTGRPACLPVIPPACPPPIGGGAEAVDQRGPARAHPASARWREDEVEVVGGQWRWREGGEEVVEARGGQEETTAIGPSEVLDGGGGGDEEGQDWQGMGWLASLASRPEAGQPTDQDEAARGGGGQSPTQRLAS